MGSGNNQECCTVLDIQSHPYLYLSFFSIVSYCTVLFEGSKGQGPFVLFCRIVGSGIGAGFYFYFLTIKYTKEVISR